MVLNIAALLTCHNRKNKTLSSLKSLFSADLPLNYSLDVFLVDDGSTDGTGEAVKEKFPQVSVIRGDGNLFWNQGMRLAWKTASKTKEYDFYLWLNDDTNINVHAIINLFEDYHEALLMDDKPLIITGACKTSIENKTFSYGGRTEKGPVIPNGELQKCMYINGNFVLVPNEIYKVVGNLSSDYTHAMGDFDYGLSATKSGFNCYTTKKYVAFCLPNEGVPNWCNPEFPLRKRWDLFYSPFGLNIIEYNTFRRKFWGHRWIIYALKAYFKMLSPRIYNKISKK